MKYINGITAMSEQQGVQQHQCLPKYRTRWRFATLTAPDQLTFQQCIRLYVFQVLKGHA